MSRKQANKKVVKSVQKNLNKDLVYQERVKKVKKKHTAEELPLLINPTDTTENPLTHSRLMDWLASTGWVYGYVRKRISPMDAALYEDYAQHCWLAILQVKPERMMEIWYNGKGAFVNYIKRIIDVQLKSTTCPNFNINKRFHHNHCMLSDEQWRLLEEGSTTATYIDAVPVRCICPSGNRKKMVEVGYEEQEIHVDPDFNLSELQ